MLALLFKEASSPAPAVGIQVEGVSRTWPESALMHAATCPHSLPGSTTECLPQGHTRKQVCFDLTEDLGSALLLPTDLAHFLGDTTDKHVDTPHPPAPSAMSSP